MHTSPQLRGYIFLKRTIYCFKCLLLTFLFIVYIHEVEFIGPQAWDKIARISITSIFEVSYLNNSPVVDMTCSFISSSEINDN